MASYVGSFIGRYHLESITVSRCGAGISPASSERFAPGQLLALLAVGLSQTDERFSNLTHILRNEFGIEGAESVGGPILSGEHGMDARNARRRSDIDATDAGMGMRRVEEDSIDLASEVTSRTLPPATPR